MDAALLAPARLRKLIDLRYRDLPLAGCDLRLFAADGLVDQRGELTAPGYDVAYAATEYLGLLENPDDELFRIVDLDGARVLDAGCAGGAYVFRALELGAREAVGVDLNENYLMFARALRQELGRSHPRFITDDVEALERVEGPFDVVISRLVTPLIDLEDFVEHVSPLANRGCELYLKTHAIGYYGRDARDQIRARDLLRVGRAAFAVANGALENTLHRRLTLTRGPSRHKDTFYTRRYVYRALENNGWRVRLDNWRENRRTPFVVATKS